MVSAKTFFIFVLSKNSCNNTKLNGWSFVVFLCGYDKRSVWEESRISL